MVFRGEHEVEEHQPVAIVAKLKKIHVPSIELEGDVAVNHKAKHHDDSICVDVVVRELCDKIGKENEEVYSENVQALVQHTLKRSFAHLFLKTVLSLLEVRHYSIKLFIVPDFADEAFSSISHLEDARLHTLNNFCIRDIQDLANVRILYVKLVKIVSEPIVGG